MYSSLKPCARKSSRGVSKGQLYAGARAASAGEVVDYEGKFGWWIRFVINALHSKSSFLVVTRAVKQVGTRPQHEFAGNRLQRSEAGWNELEA